MKTKKQKRTSRSNERLVLVDMGYGPADHWVEAKVIREQVCQSLFGDGVDTHLFVELLGGERIWVTFWKEITEPDKTIQ